jgi:hypothetical protein
METGIPSSESKFYEWATVTYPYATSGGNVQRWGVPSSAISPEMTTVYSIYTARYLVTENPTT